MDSAKGPIHLVARVRIVRVRRSAGGKRRRIAGGHEQ